MLTAITGIASTVIGLIGMITSGVYSRGIGVEHPYSPLLWFIGVTILISALLVRCVLRKKE